jgi:hypothetical protein
MVALQVLDDYKRHSGIIGKTGEQSRCFLQAARRCADRNDRWMQNGIAPRLTK